MDNVGGVWIAKKAKGCPCAVIGKTGFVDNVDNVYLKIIKYHIYCIYIQWCIYTLLSGANLDRGVHIAHIVHTSPTSKSRARIMWTMWTIVQHIVHNVHTLLLNR